MQEVARSERLSGLHRPRVGGATTEKLPDALPLHLPSWPHPPPPAAGAARREGFFFGGARVAFQSSFHRREVGGEVLHTALGVVTLTLARSASERRIWTRSLALWAGVQGHDQGQVHPLRRLTCATGTWFVQAARCSFDCLAVGLPVRGSAVA